MPMDTEQLRAEVARFPVWHYEFDLNGVTTPIRVPAHRNRHAQRSRYFFEPLVGLFGGSLKGKRVLDLGCNAGYWSLKAIEAGADYVLGVDGRQMHVDQANLVFQAKEIEPQRYKFRTGNVFTDDFAGEGPFDIVLCLGLLYHVSKPVELIERIAAINTDVLLIDTEVSGLSGVVWRTRRESLDEPRNAIDYEQVFIPSRLGVIELARAFGYAAVALQVDASSYSGMSGYVRGKRVAFMCAKKTDLSSLPKTKDDEPLAGVERAVRGAFRLGRGGFSAARLLVKARTVSRGGR